MVHNTVVVPKTGKMPRTIPKVMQRAIFLLLIPSLSDACIDLKTLVFSKMAICTWFFLAFRKY
jgi:hypothetical protein